MQNIRSVNTCKHNFVRVHQQTNRQINTRCVCASQKDPARSRNGNVRKKSCPATSTVTRTTRVVTTGPGRRQNNRSPQKKQQAVAVVSKCITSKVTGTASPTRHKTDSLTTRVARSELASKSGAVTSSDLKTQTGAKTSTVQQKLKVHRLHTPCCVNL